MNNTSLQAIQERLEQYGFRRFVEIHFDYLLKNTLRHERLGKELVALGVIDESERRTCMERCGNKERNIQFYNLLVVREAHWELLVALYFSNNNRVLRFIGDQLGKHFTPVGHDALQCCKALLQHASNSQHFSMPEEDNLNNESALLYWNAIMEETLFT